MSEVPLCILKLPNPYVVMIPNPKPYTELDSPHEAERGPTLSVPDAPPSLDP